jgi:hypothetical protein
LGLAQRSQDRLLYVADVHEDIASSSRLSAQLLDASDTKCLRFLHAAQNCFRGSRFETLARAEFEIGDHGALAREVPFALLEARQSLVEQAFCSRITHA